MDAEFVHGALDGGVGECEIGRSARGRRVGAMMRTEIDRLGSERDVRWEWKVMEESGNR